MQQKVRMADIAAKLGISIVSVSKGLAGKDGVSEEMRARIIETAKEIGYISAYADKKEKNRNAGTIGLLVADRFFADNAFYYGLYRAVLVRATAAGYSVLLEIVQAEDEQACRMPALLTAKKVDSLIFMGELDRGYLRTAMRSGLPCMLLDFYDNDMEADCVLSDSRRGAYQLTQYILAHGHRRIGFVGSIFATSSIMDRYQGYELALLQNGIQVHPDWVLEDRDAAGNWIPLALPEEMPDAFVCSCDSVAFQLVEDLKQGGLRVPEDVAVVGYDDYRYSTLSTPQLTTYRVNVEEMAAAVLSQLIRKMHHKRTTHGDTCIHGKLIERESV